MQISSGSRSGHQVSTLRSDMPIETELGTHWSRMRNSPAKHPKPEAVARATFAVIGIRRRRLSRRQQLCLPFRGISVRAHRRIDTSISLSSRANGCASRISAAERILGISFRKSSIMLTKSLRSALLIWLFGLVICEHALADIVVKNKHWFLIPNPKSRFL